MKQPPAWLPTLIDVGGEWQEIVKRLYAVYEQDFKHNTASLNGLTIFCDRRILPDETYEEGFWHLVTRTDQRTKERFFDPRRAERLAWCRAVLHNIQEPEVISWVYCEGN